jgi:type IV secretion system protein TrbI
VDKAGKALPTVEQITAQVTENVYDSPSGKFLLIPQGARLVGQYWGNLVKAAAISTLLGIGSELVLNSNNAVVQALRTGAENTVNQTGQTLVSRQLNVQPTLTIRPGFPVRVVVTAI